MAGDSNEMRSHMESRQRSFLQVRPPRRSAPSAARWLSEAMAEDRRFASSQTDIKVTSPARRRSWLLQPTMTGRPNVDGNADQASAGLLSEIPAAGQHMLR